MTAKKPNSAKDFLDYLKGEAASGDRHELERSLQSDPFEAEAMEGLESLEAGQAEEDLLALHGRLRRRLSRRKRIGWYSVAATIASILIVGTIFLQIYDFNPPSEQELQDQMALPLEAEQAAPGTACPRVAAHEPDPDADQ